MRFSGQYFDQESNLYYNYLRYYDPSIGTYLTSDPIGLKDGVNTYRYAHSNSLNYVDSMGMAALNPATGAGGGFVIAGPPGAVVGLVVGTIAIGITAWGINEAVNHYNKPPSDAKDPEGAKAPGKPGAEEGFEDPKDGEVRYENRQFYQLELVANDGTLSQYRVTDDHPFWVKDIGWVESDELQQGMPILDLQNDVHTVHYFSPTGERGLAYNFEVADFHTYFVGREDIWVHNCPDLPEGYTPSPGLKGDPYSPSEVDKRRSQRRRDMETGNLDPDSPIPDQGPGRDMGGHDSRGGTPHDTNERNVNRHEEHSRRPKGGFR